MEGVNKVYLANLNRHLGSKGFTAKDLFDFEGEIAWVNHGIIFLGLMGSKGYGTALQDSDTDIRGVYISPREFYLGFSPRFEVIERHRPYDKTLYDIKNSSRWRPTAALMPWNTCGRMRYGQTTDGIMSLLQDICSFPKSAIEPSVNTPGLS
jgi:hypothetical protein